MPSLLTDSPSSAFTPRREFIRDQRQTTNSFSLLTLASSNLIRLYSFPTPVIRALRQLFDTARVTAGFREDTANNFCEFALQGKPWVNAKSVASERLLLEIFSILYKHGHSCLSTIDYGRENDDKVAIAFSKASLSPPTSRPHSPPPVDLSPPMTQNRIPFAISFASAVILRVINPPLHCTPAILQAVRGSWPRGVVSEKKVGSNSFEFKLKGYKWFQEDTFSTDSLQHILALLGTLDTHSFTLLTSICLTSRSKVKDLWIFTAPPPASTDGFSLPESPAPSILNAAAEFKRSNQSLENSPLTGHRKLSSEPSSGSPGPVHYHARSATDSPQYPSGLRKPAPRAQVPISALEPATDHRMELPSVISEGLEDMTGVGAQPHQTPDVFYQTSPFEQGPPPVLVHQQDFSQDSASGAPLPRQRDSPVPSLVSERPTHPTPAELIALNHTNSSSSGPTTPPTPTELLGATAFRDTSFSSQTDMTTDIPIKWTGPQAGYLDTRPSGSHVDSVQLPGGWQPTPIEEKSEELPQFEPQQKSLDEPVQDVRVASPKLKKVDSDNRPHSEAGLVVMPELPAPLPLQVPNSDVLAGSTASGKGWVLVDVEGKDGPSSGLTVTSPTEAQSPPMMESPEPMSPTSTSPSKLTKPAPVPITTDSEGVHPKASMSAAAKAVVTLDAVDTQAKSQSSTDSGTKGRVRKWFSISRKTSVRSQRRRSKLVLNPVQKDTDDESKHGFGLRSKKTPQASRKKNRMSIDGQ